MKRIYKSHSNNEKVMSLTTLMVTNYRLHLSNNHCNDSGWGNVVSITSNTPKKVSLKLKFGGKLATGSYHCQLLPLFLLLFLLLMTQQALSVVLPVSDFTVSVSVTSTAALRCRYNIKMEKDSAAL